MTMLSFFRRLARTRKPVPGARRPQKARLSVDRLEDRLTPSAGTLSPEFHVNYTTASNQSQVATSTAPGGTESIVVWTGVDPSTGRTFIYGQLYNAGGDKIGTELTLANDSTYDSYNLSEPSVSMDQNGYFVLSYSLAASPTFHYIFWGSYDPSGNAYFTEDYVDGGTFNDHQSSIGFEPGNPYNVIIAYTQDTTSTNSDIEAASGVWDTGATSTYITVAATSASETNPKVAINADGTFDIAYQSKTSTNGGDILLRQYDASSNLTNVVTVASGTTKQQLPSLSNDQNGNMVVAWQQYSSSTNWDIMARRVNSSGTPGATVTISSAAGAQTAPAVALDPTNGTYMVAYHTGSSIDVTEVKGTTVQGTLTATASAVTVTNDPVAISMRGDHYYQLVYVKTNGGFFTDPADGIFGEYGKPS